MVLLPIILLVALVLWLSTHWTGAIAGTVGLVLMGACTWFLPFPYDYTIPTGTARLEGGLLALAIGFTPYLIRRSMGAADRYLMARWMRQRAAQAADLSRVQLHLR